MLITKNWTLANMSGGSDILASGDPGAAVNLVSFAISNYDPADDAIVSLSLYSTGGTFKGYILPSGSINYTTTVYIDSKIFLNEGDYVYVESDKTKVSVVASGTEIT